ncbi:MAG: hypothetical protein LBF72_01865 [Holosporales bacterium]|nr:hypothetical protein [Holosporales bacterium]
MDLFPNPSKSVFGYVDPVLECSRTLGTLRFCAPCLLPKILILKVSKEVQ